ncbi:hypothetical protein DICPUDRAFT_50749 [Dictyostelium purpureum]|uniref:Uncharacterized protein n=1 Tax=Dictyostelium purpureum TaxID=5786 RepID=F1A057_DICPU|nr:uncharacterized protein DICPUDRAFT_50749 [Dictyostelium purpureum]EGC30428.1 hypothetical protein DICPUDRAFT_50749 [Dictyostelium purpureum]|eukprot:XP_003293052.1 hypothetical protein DICPUDRAFT_50749 [Dictyostelium purpureum]
MSNYKRPNNSDTNGSAKKTRLEDDDPMSSILGEIHQSQHGNKSTAVKSTFSLESVMNKIIELSQTDGGIDKIEVEGRIGLFSSSFNSGSTFKPGMVPEDWKELNLYLRNKYDPICTRETDYIYNDNFRITFDENTKKCIRKDRKTDKTNFDQSSNLIYDYRISTSIEETFPPPLSLPSDYISRREKERFTYREDLWKVDLTIITTRQNIQAQIESLAYEVEVELYPDSIKSCQEKSSLTSLLNKFIDGIKHYINVIGGSQDTSFSDISLDRVGEVKEIYRLRDLVFKYMPQMQRRTETFPGSMPVNFGKKNFYYVQCNKYYVSEKTDGIRYMLLVDSSGVYLIDRKFDFYKLNDYDIIIDIFRKGTLLDGEMVRNVNSKTPNYLVFDVLSINDQIYYDKFLEDRLKVIGSEVVLPIRKKVNSSDVPFEIMGKSFQPKNKIQDVFKHIKDDHNGTRTFIDGRRCHHTDGIIFTPNTPYRPYTDPTLYKWKYCDKWTIDFKVRDRGQKGWFLSCVANDNIEVDCREVNFSDDDLSKLRKEFQRARDQSTVVAECSFQPKTGTWKFHQVRHDKKKGNYISIVMDTMESIAENLSGEELKYRIPLSPQDDNWEEEMQRLRSSMLNSIKPSTSSSTSSYNPYSHS